MAVVVLALAIVGGAGLGAWFVIAPDRALQLAIELGHEILRAALGECARLAFSWLWTILTQT